MIQAGAIDGAIIGGVSGALISIVFMFIARSNQKKGKAAGRPTIQDIWWYGSYDQGFQRALQILNSVQAKVLNADQQAGVILAGTSVNFRTFGSTVHVRFFQEQGAIRVRIEAAPSGSLFDNGFSRKLVDRFIQNWNSLPAPMPNHKPGDFIV